MKCAVDLRDRETGKTVSTLCVTDDPAFAWNMVADWNEKNLPDYHPNKTSDDYIGHSSGLVADCYYID